MKPLALIAASALLLHHYINHPELQFPDRLFQINDISNHETWIVVLVAVGLL